jgi:hypothetical protein
VAALEPHVTTALMAHWDSAKTEAGGVVGHVRQLVATSGMVDPRQHMNNRQSHPFDTHPELLVRLEALKVWTDGARPDTEAASLNDDLMRRANDPVGSRVLQELGLEAETVATGESTDPAEAETVVLSGTTMRTGEMAAPVMDINAALQSELTSVAASNRQEKIAALTAIVRLASNAQPVISRLPIPIVLLVAFMAILVAGVGGALVVLGKAPGVVPKGLLALSAGIGGWLGACGGSIASARRRC